MDFSFSLYQISTELAAAGAAASIF